MMLVGFIPYTAKFDPTLFINMNEDMIVTPSLVRFKNHNRPVSLMKYIKLPEETKYKYNRNIRIATIEAYLAINQNQNGSRYISKDFADYENTPSPILCNKIIKKYNTLCVGNFEKDDFGLLVYCPDATEFIFTRENITPWTNEEVNPFTYIADDFLCLCVYINKVTGIPSYSTFPPQDLIKVLDNNDKK